jgi:hypothetical protein
MSLGVSRGIFLAGVLLVGTTAARGDAGFLRGDANSDKSIDIGDAVMVLSFLFGGVESIPCLAAADADSRGDVNITDAVYLLNFLFLGGLAPKAPFPDCGAPPDDAGAVLKCQTPQCIVDPPPATVWMIQPDGCRQCTDCLTLSLEDVVDDLLRRGFHVANSGFVFVPVCAACTCPSGRNYAVLIPSSQVEELAALGWSPTTEPPVEPN